MFLFSANCLMMLYICTKFRKNISNFQRGIILSKVLVKLQFLISAHCQMMLCISTKFHENISKVSELLRGHDFPTKI